MIAKETITRLFPATAAEDHQAQLSMDKEEQGEEGSAVRGAGGDHPGSAPASSRLDKYSIFSAGEL